MSDMFISTREDLIEATTRVLHDIDPANTYCNMNEGMENEYELEANEIVSRFLDKGMLLRRSFTTAFEETFDGTYNEQKVLMAYRVINNQLS